MDILSLKKILNGSKTKFIKTVTNNVCINLFLIFKSFNNSITKTLKQLIWKPIIDNDDGIINEIVKIVISKKCFLCFGKTIFKIKYMYALIIGKLKLFK